MATRNTVDMADMFKDASMTTFISVIKEAVDTSSASRIYTAILKIITPTALSIKL